MSITISSRSGHETARCLVLASANNCNSDVTGGGHMTTLQAIMFGFTLALTPSLLALAFFLYREWLISRSEDAGRLELHD
jgi:hypothetical protein